MTPKLLLTLVLATTTLLAENWPFWRGATRQGVSKETGLPLHGNTESNVVWKVKVPGEAWSSPIVYGDEV
ncbi:MAG: hypothetical protein ACXW3Z_14910, partial [Limisphaerales bacterium]